MTSTLQVIPDRTRLAPDDAYINHSSSTVASGAGLRSVVARQTRNQRGHRSRSRRRRGTWKKLLWVKQSYPDNYTDEDTFLDALQLNPKLRPYDFWPLVMDSTVIVQQVCTMIMFVCCFAGIIQERVSPIMVVTWGTIGTVLGWVVWDAWVGREQASKAASSDAKSEQQQQQQQQSLSRVNSFKEQNLGLGLHVPDLSMTSSRGQTSSSSAQTGGGGSSSSSTKLAAAAITPEPSFPQDASRSPPPPPGLTSPSTSDLSSHSHSIPPDIPQSSFSPRNQQRLATAKSALLIYCALLGLSPILKSLTESTASDSIWAISFWLMCINVVFFDYGGGVGATLPASLSTNAALMASTVLASRLSSTTDVFSLTLFSIEVFGLFPVFRRYLRHVSWHGHLTLTVALVMSASAGVALAMSGGGWMAAIVGMVLGSLLTSFAMGLCSWWLIGLQRFKNEIHGPWDPARPIIRRWD